jgi:hypothetical protein
MSHHPGGRTRCLGAWPADDAGAPTEQQAIEAPPTRPRAGAPPPPLPCISAGCLGGTPAGAAAAIENANGKGPAGGRLPAQVRPGGQGGGEQARARLSRFIAEACGHPLAFALKQSWLAPAPPWEPPPYPTLPCRCC